MTTRRVNHKTLQKMRERAASREQAETEEVPPVTQTLTEQLKASERKNRKESGGLGFEQMVVTVKNVNLLKSVPGGTRCEHCQGPVSLGQVIFVTQNFGVIIHATCIKGLAESAPITSTAEASLEDTRQRIEKTGSFYG